MSAWNQNRRRWITIVQFSLGGPLAGSLEAHEKNTQTPIKHVIVLIGENRTFDHLFATYVPKSRDSVSNLLSKGIINADGTPGPHFPGPPSSSRSAFQLQVFHQPGSRPESSLRYPPRAHVEFFPQSATGEPPPFPTGTPTMFLASIEPSLETGDLNLLTTGAPGVAQTAELPDFDTRVNNFDHLPNGPFPLAGANLPYDSLHRRHHAPALRNVAAIRLQPPQRHTPESSGCLNDLYPFVITPHQ